MHVEPTNDIIEIMLTKSFIHIYEHTHSSDATKGGCLFGEVPFMVDVVVYPNFNSWIAYPPCFNLKAPEYLTLYHRPQ